MYLFCLHHAGGSSFSYNKLKQYINNAIEMVVLDLPGRAGRLTEQLTLDFDVLIKQLVNQINTFITGDEMPYMIFGHSLGCLLAYYIYIKLEELSMKEPAHIFFCGRQAPYVPMEDWFFKNNDPEILKENIIKSGGLSHECLHNEKLFNYYWNLILYDFNLISNAPAVACAHTINSNLSILWGKEDETLTYKDMLRWRETAGAGITFHMLNGGHMSPVDNLVETSSIINEAAFDYIKNGRN